MANTVPQDTLVDLLDRILDRGVVVYADVVISLAGVPLIALQLRAAIAGVETMLRYGVSGAWQPAQGEQEPCQAQECAAFAPPPFVASRSPCEEGEPWPEQLASISAPRIR